LVDEPRFAARMRLADFRVTRRGLRLGSGLVLFTYIAVHLVNHALGLVSLDVAEAGLRVAVRLWHSIVGTALLYGAAAIHLVLAMVAVYQRRRLRMPPIEVLRIALGFSMPLLLIGHFATARVGFELYHLAPDYHRIVWALWTSNGQGRQLALLAPGWLHGCLGLNLAFGRRPLFRRLRPALLVAAVLLPVLAALGFMAMGRELAALGFDRHWLDVHVSMMDADQAAALARIKDAMLVAYVGLIGSVFAGRAVRAQIARRRFLAHRVFRLRRHDLARLRHR
jgi:adenylate cyclase